MSVSAGILAGGASSRMGRDKALLEFRGKPLLAHQIDLLRPLFQEVIIAGGSGEGFGARVVPDVLQERCSLTGLHALLAAASTSYVFTVACDMPFLHPELIRTLLKPCELADVVIPVGERGPEPLHAVYSKRCLPAIEFAASLGDWKMTGFLKKLKVLRIPVKEADWLVEGRSPFTNANTPEDWRAAAP